MENISIKVHPPWYARGTPIINTRDGPPMALSNKLLFAIRGGPSARGKPKDLTRLWLTLKTMFFNTQNSVYSQWYKRLGRIINDKICISTKPRRGAMIIENDMIYKPKTRRVDMIIDDMICTSTKPQRGERIIDMAKIETPKTRRVDMIKNENDMHNQIRRLPDDMNIELMKTKNITPLGLFENLSSDCYNLTIPVGIKTQPQRGARFIEDDMIMDDKIEFVMNQNKGLK